MFAPRGIAIVGASDRSGWSAHTLSNLQRAGYPHNIHLVNQRGGTAHGEPVIRSLSELDEPVDLAYVLTGPSSLPAIMTEAAERGIRNLVVIAAGFGEMGAEGARRERELAARADDLGLRLLGPNNLGFINTSAGTAPWSSLMPWPIEKGNIGVLSQSGALGIFLLNYLESRDVAISHLITVGNEAAITVAEGMDYLLAQPQTEVIALYLESVRHPDLFLDAAERALAAGKPIVTYKAGRGSIGAKITAAHTGSLAGDDAVFDAVFRQHGIIRVDTIEDLVATAGLLGAYGELPGRRVAFVTGSGAMCGVIGDVSEQNGLILPDLDPCTIQALYAGGLPDFATAQNPLDTTGYVVIEPELLPMSEAVVSQDPGIDILVVHGSVPSTPQGAEMAERNLTRRAALARSSPVPVIPMEFFPTERTPYARAFRRERGLPFVVDSFTRGIPALAKAIWWSEQRALGRSSVDETGPVEGPTVDTGRPWSEREVTELLHRHGIPVVEQRLVGSVEDAARVAAELTGPFALKVSSPDIAHKSDVGGVRLGLTADDVGAAYAQMMAQVRLAEPDAVIEGGVLSPMRPDGVDLIVGVVRDAVWGLTLVIGLGGIWVEVLRDSVIRAIPVGRAEIRSMFSELKSAPLLSGARGGKPVDLDAVTDVIVSVVALARSLGDRLAALEINPLRVRGAEVEVLDALITWT
jgi:acyl-CoA synthetase (NDP forming)